MVESNPVKEAFGYEALKPVLATMKHGKYVAQLPEGFREDVYHFTKVAEKEKGRAPYIVEVSQVMKRDSKFPIPMNDFVRVACYDLFRNDELLLDRELHRVSANPANQRTEQKVTEFEVFSDRYQRMFSQYKIGDRLRLLPGEKTPVVNFKQLKDILLSKDLSRASELDWIDAGELRFLDGEDMKGNMIAFQSFPRTGNSMLRRFLETISGLFTSSDMNLDIAIQLQMVGMLGEENVTDTNLTWITKTHWPINFFKEAFHANKMLVIVRNPIEIFPSFCSLMQTGSHSVMPQKPFTELSDDFWKKWVSFVTEMLKQNHERVTRISNKVPTFYVRFEDIRTNPVPILGDVFKFLFDVPSIEGTVLEKRIT